MNLRLARVIVLVGLFAGICLPASASVPDATCTWTGAVSDDWNTNGNWSCGHKPELTDTVIVGSAGRQPRLRATGQAGTLTINGGGTLVLDPNTPLTIASGLVLNQAAGLIPGTSSAITLQSGNWTDNGASVSTTAAWTATFDGFTDQAIGGSKASHGFSNLTVNNMSMGTPEIMFGGSTATVNVKGMLTLNQDAVLDTGTASQFNLSGNLLNNGGSLLGNATLNLIGSNDQSIGGSAPQPTFPALVKVNKSAGKVTLGSGTERLIVNGALEIQGGTLQLGGKGLTTNSTTTVGHGTLDLGGGGWTANGGITLGPGSVFVPGAGTVTLNNGNWTNNLGSVTSSLTPWSLILSGPSQEINGTSGTQTFGNLTLANPTMAPTSVQGGGSLTTARVGGALTIGPDTTFNAGTIRSLGIGGDLVNNGGAFQGSANLQTTFNGSGDQTIGGTISAQTFPGSIMVNKPGGTLALGGSTSQLTVGGSFQVVGGTFNLNSGVLTTGGSTEIFKTGTLNLGAGTWNANSHLYLETGGTLDPGSGTLNFSGSYFGFYGGTLLPGTWTANFLLSGNQLIGGKGVVPLHNVNVLNNAMSPATLRVGSSSSGPSGLSMTGDVTIGEDATLDAGTATTIWVGGDWLNNGHFYPRSGTVVFDGKTPAHGRAPAAVQTIAGAEPTTFRNLTVDNLSGVTLGASQIISGVLDLKTGDLTAAANTLTLGSAATVTGTHEVVGAVRRTQTFAAGVPYAFNQRNLILVFDTVGAMSSLTVIVAKSLPDLLQPALPRTVTITPDGAGYTATLRLPYLDAELNGIPEADLRLWRRGPRGWETKPPQNVNPVENWVEQSGITAFSTWALAPADASAGSRIYLPLALRDR